MTDPMLTINGSDTGAARVVKHNENVRRRFTPHPRIELDVDVTQTATDEFLRCSADVAARTLTLLPAATANTLHVDVVDADATQDFTVQADGSELIDGSNTLVLTAPARLILIPDGTGWCVFDCTP